MLSWTDNSGKSVLLDNEGKVVMMHAYVRKHIRAMTTALDIVDALNLGVPTDHLLKELEIRLREAELLMVQVRSINDTAVTPVVEKVVQKWPQPVDDSFGNRNSQEVKSPS
jgi:hypothetical protein